MATQKERSVNFLKKYYPSIYTYPDKNNATSIISDTQDQSTEKTTNKDSNSTIKKEGRTNLPYILVGLLIGMLIAFFLIPILLDSPSMNEKIFGFILSSGLSTTITLLIKTYYK